MSSIVPWLVVFLIGAGASFIGPHLPLATWTWPLLMTVAFYPFFARSAFSGQLGRAVGLALVWALGSTIGDWGAMRTMGVEAIGPDVIRGPQYAADMLRYIDTGVGAEGSPSKFIPEHARHYSFFLLASGATGGFAGLFFGTVLLNYMNFYVASLAAATSPAAFAIGWPVWAIVRVVGFVAGAAAMSHLFYARILRRGEFVGHAVRRWMLISVGLVLLDIMLKASLAETWRGWLAKLF